MRRARLPRPIEALVLLACCGPATVASAAGTLINQTVARVGKHVLTLRAVQIDYAVNQLLDRRNAPDLDRLRTDSGLYVRARQGLVHRMLIRTYLDVTGLARVPEEPEMEKIRRQLHAAFDSEASAEAYFRRHSIAPSELDTALGDRLLADRFLNEQLPVRITVDDDTIRTYYERERDARFLGKPFTEVRDIARESLRRERLEREFDEWVKTEMRRTDVVLYPLSAPDPSK